MGYLFIVGAGIVGCLLPLCIYLQCLSSINSRPRPTVVSGSVDFSLLLAGLSGFLIAGGPVAVSFFDNSIGGLKLASSLSAMANAFARNQGYTLALSLVYVLALAALVVYGHFVRRRQTVIYNVVPAVLYPILDDLLNAESPPLKRGTRSDTLAAVVPEENHTFESICLHWTSTGRSQRNRLEGELAKRLRSVPVPPNPLAGLLMNISLGVGLVMIGTVGIFVLLIIKTF